MQAACVTGRPDEHLRLWGDLRIQEDLGGDWPGREKKKAKKTEGDHGKPSYDINQPQVPEVHRH